MSTTSNTVTPESLGSSLKRCRAQAISYKGTNGHFVSSARLDNIESSIEEMCRAMDDNQKVAINLPAMREEIESLRKSAAVAEAALANAKVEVQAAQKSYKDYKLKVDPMLASASRTQDDLNAQKAELAAQLKQAQCHNESAKKASRAADKGFDPEVALTARAERDSALASLKDIQHELEATNASLSKLHKEKDMALKELAARLARQSELETTVRELQATRLQAMEDIPVRKVTVEINTPALKFLLGDKGIGWIQSAAEAHETEVREKVFRMINALKGHKSNRVVNGLLGLLQVAFDWIKSQSYRARMAIQPWVAMVEEDLRKGILRQLSYYRSELEKVVNVMKTKAKKIHEDTREKFKHHRKTYFGFFSLWDEITSWTKVFRNRAVRLTNRIATSIKSYFDSWWYANPGEKNSDSFRPITLFDYEDGLPKDESGAKGIPPPPGGG